MISFAATVRRLLAICHHSPPLLQSKTNDMHRTEIESLRLDKLQRQRILRRLERDLAETRARVTRKRDDAQVGDAGTSWECLCLLDPSLRLLPLIPQSMTAARDKAQRDITALQATLQQEQEQFEVELQVG